MKVSAILQDSVLSPFIPEILTIWIVKVNFVLTGIDH
jgi:hypothetical protein